MNLLGNAIAIIVFIMLSIIVHELGHYISYSYISGKKATFKFNRLDLELYYKDISSGDYLAVLVAGVAAGYIPLAMLFDIWDYGFIGSLFITIFYIAGCTHDFIQILRCFQND